MIECKDLESVVQCMCDFHKPIKQTATGAYAVASKKNPDGSKIPFMEIESFRLYNYQIIDENTLGIHFLSGAFSYLSGNHKQHVKGRIVLQNLIQVRLYNYSAHFLSYDSIDFGYMIQNVSSNVVAMQEWLNREDGELIAKWVSGNYAKESKRLDAESEYQKVKQVVDVGRRIFF